jgi:hypothetical protein
MRQLHESACLARDYPTQAESFNIHFSGKEDVMRGKTLPLFELASVLVRLDHVARLIVNANHSMM